MGLLRHARQTGPTQGELALPTQSRRIWRTQLAAHVFRAAQDALAVWQLPHPFTWIQPSLNGWDVGIADRVCFVAPIRSEAVVRQRVEQFFHTDVPNFAAVGCHMYPCTASTDEGFKAIFFAVVRKASKRATVCAPPHTWHTFPFPFQKTGTVRCREFCGSPAEELVCMCDRQVCPKAFCGIGTTAVARLFPQLPAHASLRFLAPVGITRLLLRAPVTSLHGTVDRWKHKGILLSPSCCIMSWYGGRHKI